jgi:flagellar hook-length control protein FliK
VSIEKNSPAASPQLVAGAASHGGKSKSVDEADVSVRGSFAAVMTSIGPEVRQNEVPDTEGADEEHEQRARQLSVVPPAPNLPDGLVMLLAQAGTMVDDKLSAVGEAGVSGAKMSVRLSASAIGLTQLKMPMDASGSPVPDGLTTGRKNENFSLAQMAQGLPAQFHKARGTGLQADAAAKFAESRVPRQLSFVDVVAREPALPEALLISGSGDGLLRIVERATAKPSAFSAGSGVEGSWGQQALSSGNRVDAPPVTADPLPLSLEPMVADTVDYWVAQGVQNAELKLDGFDGQPVEVSISLRGGDAHIGFRTDQSEIRQILEGAAGHLTDLLASEGLVLSGVSVGASGQDGRSAQEQQRNRPGARQAEITIAEVAATENRQRVNSSVGGTLDLFV